MKKALLLLSVSFLILLALPSCQKEVPESEQIKEIVIDTTLKAGADYYLSLAPLGNEDNIATILEKGANYYKSEFIDETDMFTTVYHYSPSLKNTGTDKVVLAISANPNGRTAGSKDSTIIYLNFTIK